MTYEEFNKFQADLLAQVVRITDTKGKEYANNDESRFANFDRLATMIDLPNYKVAWVLFVKHYDSISHWIKMDGKVESVESIQSRFVDAITYLTLLAGIIQEKQVPKLWKNQTMDKYNNNYISTCTQCLGSSFKVDINPNTGKCKACEWAGSSKP